MSTANRTTRCCAGGVFQWLEEGGPAGAERLAVKGSTGEVHGHAKVGRVSALACESQLSLAVKELCWWGVWACRSSARHCS